MWIEAVVSDKAQAARWTLLRPSSSVIWATAIFAVAFTARLLPVVRGGGLTGIIDYDDGVHFAAAIGLVHGQLPYRDFLLLHPPGIVLVLSPFAGLALVIGESMAFGGARLTFMALGGFNAALIAHYLRSYGNFGAVVGGLLYAVFWPAVFPEHSVLQEGLGNTCLLAALVMLSPLASGAPSKIRMVGAGCLLGFAAAIKIWAVVPMFILFAWAYFHLSGRRAAHFLLGAIGACAAACLPFFISAPEAMWRMVVLDQMQRNPTAAHIAERLRDVLGLVILPADRFSVALIAALALVAAGCVVGWAVDVARPVILLLVGFTVLLLLTPSWFFHYSGLTAAVLAITAGAAAQRLRDLSANRQLARVGVGVVVAAGLVGEAVGPLLANSGDRFPRSAFATAVSGSRCVTSDHPSALILTDRVATNIGNGCPLVVDLGGAAHHLRPDRVGVSRARNQAFQAFAVEYLASGDRTIIARFDQKNGFDENTSKMVNSWRLLAQSGRYAVRAPSS